MVEEKNFRTYVGDELYYSANGHTLSFSYSDRNEHTGVKEQRTGDEIVADVFEKCGLVLKRKG